MYGMKMASTRAPRDPNTLSNYNEYRTTHTAINYLVDFDRKLLTGDVTLTFESKSDDANKDVVLDSRYAIKLSISNIPVPKKTRMCASLRQQPCALSSV